jgi:hypothetical protein
MLAEKDDSRRVLIKALTAQQNSYRRWMRPTDIIEQSMIEPNLIEQRYTKPAIASNLFQHLVWLLSKGKVFAP